MMLEDKTGRSLSSWFWSLVVASIGGILFFYGITILVSNINTDNGVSAFVGLVSTIFGASLVYLSLFVKCKR